MEKGDEGPHWTVMPPKKKDGWKVCTKEEKDFKL